MTTQAPSSKRTLVAISALIPLLVAVTLAWYVAFVHATTQLAQFRNLALLKLLNFLMVFIDNRFPPSSIPALDDPPAAHQPFSLLGEHDDHDDDDDDGASMHSSSARDDPRLSLPLHDAKPNVSTELRSLLVQ